MTEPTATPPPDSRDTLAILCRTVPPYRQHVHRRIVAEIPQYRLVTINTHLDAWRNWQVRDAEAIGLVDLGAPIDQGAKQTGWLTRLRADWERGGQAIEVLKREQAKVVVVNGYNDPGRLRVLRWCHRNGVPSLIWSDSNIAGESRVSRRKALLKQRFVRYVLSLVDGVFACGRMGKEFWMFFGAKAENIFIAPYEPSYDAIQQITSAEIIAVSDQLGLARDRRRIIFSGRLVPAKRPDLLLEAFTRIANERPDWDLVMLGDGELRSQLQSMLPSELQSRVSWIPFSNDMREVFALYKLCDILVLPSDYEPWALVINEAVAAGLAVVASDRVAAAAELVTDVVSGYGANGCIVPAGDMPKLADALRHATHPDVIDQMKAAAPTALKRWQSEGDPISGFRKAINAVTHSGADD